MYICALYAYKYLQKPKEGVGFPYIGVTGVVSYTLWALQEQRVILTVEPSLQPLDCNSYSKPGKAGWNSLKILDTIFALCFRETRRDDNHCPC